jgi:hypothetical protein
MKITFRLALASTLLLMPATSVHAGTVNVGLLNSSQYDKWLCDPSMPPPEHPAESQCSSAKFQECSDSCDIVGVTNNSDAPVNVKIEFSGAGFSELDDSDTMFIRMCDGPNGKKWGVKKPDSCDYLLPGRAAR